MQKLSIKNTTLVKIINVRRHMDIKESHLLIHILPKTAIKQELHDLCKTTSASILCFDEPEISKYLITNYVLVVPFADTTIRSHANSITVEQARDIINFVQNLPASIKDLYISCSAGQSRSPAIAAAIHRMVGRSDKDVWENPYYFPNGLVYQTLCNEFGLPTPDVYVQNLVECNRQCYLEAVKNGNAGKYEKWQIIN